MAFTARILAMGARIAAIAMAVSMDWVAVTAHAEDSTPPEAASAPANASDSNEPTTARPATRASDATDFVTVLSTPDIEARRLITLADIAAAVPEISFAPALNSSSTLSLYMRGEGPTVPGQITLDGSVGVYEDGFYIARPQADTFDLLDLDRVEVLSGPQGATYGRNTTGGVINLISQAPSGQFGLQASGDFGNRNSYRVFSSVDTPGWNGFSAKVTGVFSSIDAYVNNADAQQQGYGEEKQRAGRLQLFWDGISNLRAQYFIERSGLDSTPEYDTDPGQNGEQILYPYTYYANPSGPTTTTYRPVTLLLSTSNHTAHGLTLTWQALPALSVQSLTGYRTLGANEFQDYAEFYGIPEATIDGYRDSQISQELRVSSAFLDRQLDYEIGASYFREYGNHEDVLDFYDNGVSEVLAVRAWTRSQAVFARLHWQPAFPDRRVEISAAARRTKESKDAKRGIADEEGTVDAGSWSHISYNRTNPEVTLTYHWTDTLSTYAKGSTAFKSGGALETAPVGDFASSVFRPESSTTYEVGLQSGFLNDRLHADMAVFDSRRKDVQYALPVGFDLDNEFEFQSVTVKGASLDLRAQPTRDLALSLSGTYLNSAIDKADALAGTIFDPASGEGNAYVVGENVKGVFSLPYAPRYSGSAAGDYTFLHLDRRDLMLHLDYVYRARMFADAGAGPALPGSRFDAQPGYGLLNGRLTLSQETDWSHRVKLSLWGRNLLNRQYYQPSVGENPGGVTEYNDAGTGLAGYTRRSGAYAEPRTYGLTATYQY